MCGIFALLNNSNTFSKETIQKAIDIGIKRGPENTTSIEVSDKTLFTFHRLAINGLDNISGQPLTINDVSLICNGEIYNYRELFKSIKVKPITNSDCEIIIHLYILYGIEHTLSLLDGVFSFVIYDGRTLDDNITNGIDKKIYIARDPFGVRPLYIMNFNNEKQCNLLNINKYTNTCEPIIAIASEAKVLNQLMNYEYINGNKKKLTYLSSEDTIFAEINIYQFEINQFKPGTYSSFIKYINTNYDNDSKEYRNYWKTEIINKKYFDIMEKKIDLKHYNNNNINDNMIDIKTTIYEKLNNAVKKRVIGTSERPIACLLSGGLDSSLITAFVKKYYNGVLETYSIGMEGSEDLKHARMVAEHLGTKHTEIILTNQEFFDVIPEVIKSIESYDTTTVRASVGNYLIGKYISEHSEAKVIFNGDGSDELTGGYIYLLKAPNNNEFDNECRRLLCDIHSFDVLRSDKCISSHGLEPRTPFLDKEFVEYYLSIPASIRNPTSDNPNNVFARIHNNNKCVEKLLLRQAINQCDPNLIPKKILWRTKEAFSDGISGNSGSWFEIIKEKVSILKLKNIDTEINPPKTNEQLYYREIFDTIYPDCANIVPYFWMPKYVDATDASARSLKMYKDLQ